ncbi:hypothetical protein K491DRAFT_757202 [Lophiostoma macrostomum CBS 122681]|uniref:Extracellular mutant protein 11 C-terminal domain-containing protein n=1 Tax=Lophiostoma macrostomum CBS 122681 TaxID=1314788 RepID=A0A6A6TC42_9PLEO|nr:hypothetical protein K491DRAFT_757202 [Lophiostoma macrostomum CBS 122681]
MQGYAQSGLPPKRPSSSRQQIAANAKVQVTRGGTTHHEQVQQRQQPAQLSVHQPIQRHSGGRHNDPAFPPQQPPLRSQLPVKTDPYETDDASLDTTVPRGSVFQQVQDSQQTQPLHDYQPNGEEPHDDYEEGSDDEDDEDDGDGDDEVDDEHHGNGVRELTQEDWDYLQSHDLGHLTRDEALDFFAKAGNLIWDEAGSYPTTTSGPPDNFPDDYQEEDAALEDYAEPGHVSPSPRSGVKGQPHRQAPAPQFQAPHTAHSANIMANRHDIFQKAAGVREQTRSNPHPDGGLVAAGVHNGALPERKQRPAQNQNLAFPGETRSSKSNVQQGAVRQNSEALPQRGARPQTSAPGPAQRQVRTDNHSQDNQAATVNTPVRIKVPTSEPLEELTAESPTRDPVEDYGRDELFGMSYDQLKDQDFDTNPRAQPTVLSDDMQQKPLEERLEHVQRSLSQDDQAKFLRSLPTAEWEEAGDWFLGQFTTIIQRAREARQAKRKLAREFEDEVEKRHNHVSKKQDVVKDALSKMRNQGQGLIPKSPRVSKSPMPSKKQTGI